MSMLADLTTTTRNKLDIASDDTSKMFGLLSSTNANDWQALGKYCAKLRRDRQRWRKYLRAKCEELRRDDYETRRQRWIAKGRLACRHGVFFTTPPSLPCPCMQNDTNHPMWQQARYMASIDTDSQRLVSTAFHQPTFRRLGSLRASLRRYG